MLPSSERLFLDPAVAPAESVAALVLADAVVAENGPLDLRGHGIIVPTARAGRLLREELVRGAQKLGRGLLPPHIETPQGFFLARTQGPQLAGDLVRGLVWEKVLGAVEPAQVSTLFPEERLLLDSSRRRHTAALLQEVRQLLTEGGHTFASVADALGGDHPEARRWEQLALVEEVYTRHLKELRLEDPEDLRRALAANPPEAAFSENLWLAATPDPQPLFLRALAHRPASVRVRVCILASPGQADTFDEWGRPRPKGWGRDAPELPFPQGGIHLLPHPRAAARHAVRTLDHLADAAPSLAIALGSPEMAPVFTGEMEPKGHRVFNPEGEALRQTAFADLLEAAREFLLTDRFSAFDRLLRHPWVWHRSYLRDGPAYLLNRLRFTGEFAREHLPATLGAAVALAANQASPAEHRLLAEWDERRRAVLGPGNGFGLLRDWIAWLGAEAPSASYAQPAEQAALEAFASDLEEMENLSLARHLRPAEILEIALQRLSTRRHQRERQPDEHELLGWLELLWEPRQLLHIHGLNEGWVPRRGSGADPFLPASLRAQLGLPAAADEAAVDTYRLWVMAERRKQAGQLDVIALAADGEARPLRPSGLLFACPEAILPDRVRALFRELPPSSADLPWAADFRLKVPAPVEPEKIALSVTQFRSYLACPFRYYLRHRLRMDLRPPAGPEFDARAFGTFAHTALERLARHPDAGISADQKVIRDFLDNAVLETAAHQVGARELSAPLLLQINSVRERLRSAAGAIAESRAAGWVPRHVEWKIHEAADLRLAHTTLRGIIDLIEENTETGAWRIVDYKTSDTASPPTGEHFVGFRAGAENHVASAVFERDGKRVRWKDLQLPLYAWAASEALGLDLPAIGYFALPKAASESGWLPWEDFTASDLQAAVRCATEIIEHVHAGRFWPPAKRVPYDDFAQLFEPRVSDVIDPSALLPHAFPTDA
ncbi:MAG: PD-(D/E)XK nuclease family protein [Opitutales bacterium]|nr:PD-(D/E)XK nuclease family protein [Opitutales bacterium]